MESVENEGSTFRLWLPVTEMQDLSFVNNESSWGAKKEKFTNEKILIPPSKLEYKKVLVVEDQPFNQALISEILELEGYRVELVDNGATMMERIDSKLVISQALPDLILMDIQLPEVDGLQIIRHLKNHLLWQKLPVIAVTAIAVWLLVLTPISANH